MNKKDYKKELNQIEASEEFKKKIITLLQEEIEGNSEKEEKPKKKIIWFTAPKITVAITGILIIGIGVYIGSAVKEITQSVSVLQQETNFGPDFFKEGTIEPKVETAKLSPENPSQYFAQPIKEKEDKTEQVAPMSMPEDMNTTEEIKRVVSFPQKQENYQGIYLYNWQEHNDATKIDSTQIGNLPVYENEMQQTKTGYVPNGLSQQEMEDLVYEQATALSVNVQTVEAQSIEIVDGQETKGLYSMVGTTVEEDTITAYRDGTVEVVFATPKALQIGKPEPEAGLESQQAYVELLAQEYRLLIGAMQSPKELVTLNRTSEGEPFWQYEIYDQGDGTVANSLLNQSFTKVTFKFNESGEITGLLMQRAGELELIEEKTPISQEQATQYLLENKGFTYSTQELVISEEKIAGVELVYWNNPTSQYIMPFYKFYILETEQQEEAVNRYIEVYIQAIA